MTQFYRSMMVHASRFLFLVALLVLVVGIINAVLAMKQAGEIGYGQPGGMVWVMLLQNVLSAIISATWPFIGAALLWRIDRYLALVRAEAAE